MTDKKSVASIIKTLERTIEILENCGKVGEIPSVTRKRIIEKLNSATMGVCFLETSELTQEKPEFTGETETVLHNIVTELDEEVQTENLIEKTDLSIFVSIKTKGTCNLFIKPRSDSSPLSIKTKSNTEIESEIKPAEEYFDKDSDSVEIESEIKEESETISDEFITQVYETQEIPAEEYIDEDTIEIEIEPEIKEESETISDESIAQEQETSEEETIEIEIEPEIKEESETISEEFIAQEQEETPETFEEERIDTDTIEIEPEIKEESETISEEFIAQEQETQETPEEEHIDTDTIEIEPEIKEESETISEEFIAQEQEIQETPEEEHIDTDTIEIEPEIKEESETISEEFIAQEQETQETPVIEWEAPAEPASEQTPISTNLEEQDDLENKISMLKNQLEDERPRLEQEMQNWQDERKRREEEMLATQKLLEALQQQKEQTTTKVNNFEIPKPKPAIVQKNETPETIIDSFLGSKKALHESSTISTPVSDLQKAIGINDKFRFIKELFGGDSDLYMETINKINSIGSLGAAVSYIESKFSWDKNNESVKQLISLLRRRYM